MGNTTHFWTDDTRSSEDIIAIALSTADDEDVWWNSVDTLRFRGGETEFQLASQLTQSSNVDERRLGVNILGQLGCGNPTYVTESVDILIPMLSDQIPSVVSSATYALGHRSDERAIGPLSKLVDRPEADIRQGIAHALGGFDDAVAIKALLQLTSDVCDDVRNWATFGLGSLTEVDTPEVRAALFARINEENGEIRGEALVGLAIRKDERAIDLVREELRRDYAGSWVLKAAERVGDSSLVPLLNALRDDWGDENEKYFGDELNQAIEACVSRNTT